MLCTLLVAAVAFATEPVAADAQDSTVVARAEDTAAASPTDTVAPVLFTADSAIHFTLRANFRALGGRRTRPSGVHAATITYTDGATSREMRLRVRSRAHWRLKNCDMSPLRLSFQKQHARETIFAGLDRGRLVMHCRGGVEYEQYVLQELQLYRIYNLLTPFSHRARLARVTYVDSAGSRNIATRYAFILEDDAAMARRNRGSVLVAKGAKVGDLDSFHDALVGVFQYMIGNTDWSVAGLHNVLLVSLGDGVRPVVYDFDFSGVVDTRYAVPDYRLPIRQVRQRLYRGYCAPAEQFERVFALFQEKKPAIYALYDDHVGRLMDRVVVRSTLEYFDDFYKTVTDPRAARDRIVRRCLEAQ